MANPNNSNMVPVSSSSDDDNHPTVIVVVFISFGCLCLFAAIAFSICWFLRRRKRRCSKHVEEAGIVHVDEHKKVKEAIVQGPHGKKTVVREMEDDVHIGEAVIVKKDERVGESSCLEAKAPAGDQANSDTVIDINGSRLEK
ncbi:protein TRACHEARY ELEMENT DIFFERENTIATION-RELATED 6 [Rutidosis leptorrhynchoides]|uniref:protein TRACHEARY ELEMENT DIFFERENTIATION-RELATED 6 n=1 Tax=Rutidosis leptorrhynchoides TaxID=125765 RepID=UPI003A995501